MVSEDREIPLPQTHQDQRESLQDPEQHTRASGPRTGGVFPRASETAVILSPHLILQVVPKVTESVRPKMIQETRWVGTRNQIRLQFNPPGTLLTNRRSPRLSDLEWTDQKNPHHA